MTVKMYCRTTGFFVFFSRVKFLPVEANGLESISNLFKQPL